MRSSSLRRKPAGCAFAITASSPAIAIDQTGPYVFVIGRDDKVEQRRLRLGTGREGLAVVEDGLKPDERVVIQGQQRIRAGMTVAPQLASSPSG